MPMTQEEVMSWLVDNTSLMPQMHFNSEELDHIAMCMHHIYEWYQDRRPLGNFLTAVVNNDFTKACINADATNQKALYLYAIFVLNQIPSDYQEKVRAKKK